MNFNHMFIAGLAVSFMAFPLPTEAAGWFSAPIDHIELTSSGDTILFLAGSANHECGSKRVDYAFPNDGPGKAILAALLSWQAQGKNVNVYIASCSGTIGVFNVVVDN